MRRLIVGISGSSGVIYGVRLLEVLRDEADIETHLVMSGTGKMNLGIETDYTIKQVEAFADVIHRSNDVAATISSGSFHTDGMIVAPCSMKTLSAIVHSYTDNLLSRAADVVLKEGRKLVLMPREAPLVNHSVGRALDLFGLDPGIVRRWSGNNRGQNNERS
jgi:4-hydroxy-3-polyprenylbenzoate decarboxylase